MVIPEDSCRTGKRAKVEGVERPKSVCMGIPEDSCRTGKRAKVEGVERPKSGMGIPEDSCRTEKRAKAAGNLSSYWGTNIIHAES